MSKFVYVITSAGTCCIICQFSFISTFYLLLGVFLFKLYSFISIFNTTFYLILISFFGTFYFCRAFYLSCTHKRNIRQMQKNLYGNYGNGRRCACITVRILTVKPKMAAQRSSRVDSSRVEADCNRVKYLNIFQCALKVFLVSWENQMSWLSVRSDYKMSSNRKEVILVLKPLEIFCNLKKCSILVYFLIFF